MQCLKNRWGPGGHSCADPEGAGCELKVGHHPEGYIASALVNEWGPG